MSEAQKRLQCLARRRPEGLNGFFVVGLKAAHGLRQSVGEHQQRRLMKMRDQEQQKVFVTEAVQAPVVDVDEEIVVGASGTTSVWPHDM